MSSALDADYDEKRARKLIGSAVKRPKVSRKDTVLDALFSIVFSGLVYPQIWEDPEVDLAAMQLEPHHHVIAIASGGCNIMSYLIEGPAKITAVDLNRAHVALGQLKLAAAEHVPEWRDFYRLFAESGQAANLMLYETHLKPNLDAQSVKFWSGRGLTGRRRISMFADNFYRHGLLGRFIGTSHLLSRLYGLDLRRLAAMTSIEDQRAFFHHSIAPLFDKRFVRWITSKNISLYGLGIPPAQYKALLEAGGGDMAKVLHDRLEKLVCGFSFNDNYFAWQAFARRYAPAGSGPLPPYLQETNFSKLKAHANRASVTRYSITEELRRQPEASVDRVVLLDAQDWMDDAKLNDLWEAITDAAAPGARVIFRTAGLKTILPGRLAEQILARWTYLDQRSQQLNALDRSAIYGGFHIYELKGSDERGRSA